MFSECDGNLKEVLHAEVGWWNWRDVWRHPGSEVLALVLDVRDGGGVSKVLGAAELDWRWWMDIGDSGGVWCDIPWVVIAPLGTGTGFGCVCPVGSAGVPRQRGCLGLLARAWF